MATKKATKKKTTEKQAKYFQYDLLIKPVITEKASQGLAVFWVDRDATKTDVKVAVESVFNVKVDKVRTLNVLGKPKRKARSIGKRTDRKKAYVWLEKGQSVDIFEGL